MKNGLLLYNTITRKKEAFEPISPPYVGMYVCGPTVYGDAHLGHARPAITFDLIFRYLLHSGYKVRYVRNITDVGHLENDADEGEDKIAKKARLEQLEPMEVVQHYTYRYHQNMQQLNCLPPSIEPRASGHIPEQIKMIEDIFKNGFAYEVDGSVYFDVIKYNETYNYGKLSGRKLDELLANTRELEGQGEKRNEADFALWKKAQPQHIMRWESPWSEGFPGWHLECSTMSAKYLGECFDIHGGGMDLLFPHHECEIAQFRAAGHKEPVKYWLHNNMITVNGKKMGKSLGNFITLNALFSGEHESLDREYSPMTIRFFILQAHYRSTLDFSNEALQAAEKGCRKLMNAVKTIQKLQLSENSTSDINALCNNCEAAMNDDFNSPMVIAQLFEGVKIINSVNDGKETINADDLELLENTFNTYVFEILGLTEEESSGNDELLEGLMQTIISIRAEAKAKKDYAMADKIRDELNKLKVSIKDGKEGATWSHED